MSATELGRKVRRAFVREDAVLGSALGVLLLALGVAIVLPLWAILSKSLESRADEFVGLANYTAYFATPALVQSLLGSVVVSAVATAIVVPLAFIYAYALTRSCMRFRGVFVAIALVPILAPSLLPGIALVYLFGNQGFLKGLLFGHKLYGPLGIVLGEVFYCFPHALMILVTALRAADARLYEVAATLGTPKRRVFWTITLPGAKYGIVSAIFVVFTLVVTDFGIPRIVGGQYPVMATEIFKQVIGQQNFQMGAVVGVVLTLPALLSFVVDRIVERRQVALLSARAVAFEPRPSARFDRAMLGFCTIVAIFILGVLGTAGFASLVKLWPYDLGLSLRHYAFSDYDPTGWGAYWNSVRMAAWTALVGTSIVFCGAYLVEKGRRFAAARLLVHLVAMIPLAVPGLVLGIGYVFFFNAPGNPLNVLTRTTTILVICTIVHFYTVAHLTAVTALKQLDAEFEAVSASLKVPFWRTFARVTVPLCLPAVIDIAIYLFVNAMTTVSAVIFLYSVDTKLASIAIVNMDDSGDTAPAAAMAMMIVLTSAAVKAVQILLVQRVTRAFVKR